VVLSPICWFEPAALWSLERRWTRRFTGLAAWSIRRMVPTFPGWRRELLAICDRVLPNSRAEACQLGKLFGASPDRISVVPNGVLDVFRTASPEMFRSQYGNEDFVLYAGRIEPRKNVLGLIRAVLSLGLPLAVIGEAPAEARAYFEQCRIEGGDLVRWFKATRHDDPLLASAYAASRVFAMPSWFETPGLAALEAALAGAALVITKFGSTQEYFGDRVEYAHPGRIAGIARAIARSWSQGANPGLADFVASNYLWPDVAKRTAEVYDQVAC
jgi:glycosyltransferase involved in cell wall biosynthesis